MKRSFILTILPFLAACIHEPECTPGRTAPIRISLDWSKLAEGREKPDSMQLFLYGRASGRCAHFTIGGDTTLLLTCDDYDLLIFNNNSTVFGFRGLDSFKNAEAYILPGERAGAAQPGYIPCADWLYADAREGIAVAADMAGPVPLTPGALVTEITVQIAVEGLDRASALDARLSGAASGLYLHSRTPSPDAPARVRFSTEACEGGYTAHTVTFGCSSGTPLMLQMRATLTDGSQRTSQVDITDISGQAPGGSVQVNVGVNLNPELGLTAVIRSWKIGDTTYTELQ
ncbi:MAG: DUF5119 domain-containing protein [Rikenellaceae bacterium]|nr:DUF5119 domain-containing protein [Rikenellaceae bacterium]